MDVYIVLIGLVAFIAGFAIAYWVKAKMVFEKIKSAEEEALRILNDAKRKSETFLKEAKIESKDILYKMKAEFDAETKETKSELKERENRLIQKEENIDHKINQFEPRERDLARKERSGGDPDSEPSGYPERLHGRSNHPGDGGRLPAGSE